MARSLDWTIIRTKVNVNFARNSYPLENFFHAPCLSFTSVITLFHMITGVFAAAHDLKTEWLVVKGIKDFTGDSQPSSDEWGRFASVMAASVVANILSDPVVFQEWPNYQGNISRSTLPLPLLLLHRHIKDCYFISCYYDASTLNHRCFFFFFFKWHYNVAV